MHDAHDPMQWPKLEAVPGVDYQTNDPAPGGFQLRQRSLYALPASKQDLKRLTETNK